MYLQGTLREPDFPLHKTLKNDITIKVLSPAKCHVLLSAAHLNIALAKGWSGKIAADPEHQRATVKIWACLLVGAYAGAVQGCAARD